MMVYGVASGVIGDGWQLANSAICGAFIGEKRVAQYILCDTLLQNGYVELFFL
jgi:hypothetical protein